MLRATRHLPGSTMIRGACALGGLIALLLQGSSGGHMLLVEHTRCAEHGELVHVDEGHHHPGAWRVETDGAAFLGTSNEGSDEAHEHCAPVVDREDGLLHVTAAQCSPSLAGPDQPAMSTRAPAPVDRRRFRIAPKNSPPA
jgi:hypothetical protein